MKQLRLPETRWLFSALMGLIISFAVLLTIYVYDRLHTKPPTFAELSNRAFGVMDQDPSTALALMGEAVKADPTNPLGYTNKAVLLLRQELYTEAADSIKKAISLKPDKGEYHFFLGNCLRKAGKEEDSQEAYRKALGLYDLRVKESPEDFNLRFVRESISFLLGDKEAPDRLIKDLPRYGIVQSATQIRERMESSE